MGKKPAFFDHLPPVLSLKFVLLYCFWVVGSGWGVTHGSPTSFLPPHPDHLHYLHHRVIVLVVRLYFLFSFEDKKRREREKKKKKNKQKAPDSLLVVFGFDFLVFALLVRVPGVVTVVVGACAQASGLILIFSMLPFHVV